MDFELENVGIGRHPRYIMTIETKRFGRHRWQLDDLVPRTLMKQVCNGSHAMWWQDSDEHFSIEVPSEDVAQLLADAIESWLEAQVVADAEFDASVKAAQEAEDAQSHQTSLRKHVYAALAVTACIIAVFALIVW